MADPDWTDPCSVLAWLRPQYYAVASGAQVIRIRHGASDTQFAMTSIANLDALIRRLEADCAAAQGRLGRRAIIAG